MQKKLSLLILLSSINLLAADCNPGDQSQCCQFFESKNNISVSRLETFDKTACAMSVYTKNTEHGYRRFGFASDGQVSIFLQPGGPSTKANSMQSYLIYPFNENPSLKSTSGENVEIESGSGQTWTFDSHTSLPTQMEDCDLNVSPTFSLQNSGVTIDSCRKHLVVTVPVEVGGEYMAYKGKPLTIKDPDNKSCSIITDDLYQYNENKHPFKDGKGRYFSIELKYKSNHALGVALKRLCPKLDVSMMVDNRRPPTASAVVFEALSPAQDPLEQREIEATETPGK